MSCLWSKGMDRQGLEVPKGVKEKIDIGKDFTL